MSGKDRAMPMAEERNGPQSEQTDALFRDVLDRSRTATAVISGPQLVFRYVNPAYQRLAPGKEMLDRPVGEVWPELIGQLGPLLRRAVEGTGFEASDMRLDLQRAHDAPMEERYFTFTYEPIEFAGEPAVLIEAIETTAEVLARQAADIHARSAEERAREMNELLERLTDGFLALDPEWRFTYLNSRAEQLLQRTRDDLLGKVIWQEFPQAVSGFAYSLHAAMREQEVVEIEGFYEPLNLPLRVRAYPSEEGLSVYFADLGELKRSEAELAGLRQRAETLAKYLEDSWQPFAAGTVDGRISMVNRAFCTLVGYTEQELLGPSMRWDRLTPPAWWQKEAEVIELLNSTGEPQRYEKEYTRKDGTRIPADVLVHVVMDDDGRPSSYYSFMSDISERKYAERLKETLNEIDLLVHSTLDFDVIMHRALRAAAMALGASSGSVVMYGDDAVAVVRYSYPNEWVNIGTRFSPEEAPFTLDLINDKRPLVVGDTASDSRFHLASRERFGTKAFLAIPLVVRGAVPAGLSLSFSEVQEFAEADVDFLRKLGSSISLALENAHLFEEREQAFRELAEKDIAIRQAYSDVIDAATGGRLVLLQPEELETELGTPIIGEQKVESAQQFSAERRRLREALQEVPEPDDLVLAFGEAITNALKHAGPCSYDVRHADGRVQVVVSDTGIGIDFGRLPKATLMPGFSTKQTLGMGFTLMLELADRLLLCTGSEGTTIVIERLLEPATADFPGILA